MCKLAGNRLRQQAPQLCKGGPTFLSFDHPRNPDLAALLIIIFVLERNQAQRGEVVLQGYTARTHCSPILLGADPWHLFPSVRTSTFGWTALGRPRSRHRDGGSVNVSLGRGFPFLILSGVCMCRCWFHGVSFAPVFYLAQHSPLWKSWALPLVTALTEGLHVIYLRECPFENQ